MTQTSTTGHAVNRDVTSTSVRQVIGPSQQASSDDQSSHHRYRHRQSHAPISTTAVNAALPVVSGVTPVNVDVVERACHSSSMSASSVSTTSRGPPLLSSLTSSTAPILQQRQHHNRQHSNEPQVPVDLAETQRQLTTDDVSESKTVVDRLTSPASTNCDDAVAVRQRRNAAAAEMRPVNRNTAEQALSTHDIMPSTSPQRRLNSVTQRHSLHPQSPDVMSPATNDRASASVVTQSRTQSPPSNTTGTRQKSLGDTGSSKYAGVESADADKHHVARRLRRRRRQAPGSSTDGVEVVNSRSFSGEDCDLSASKWLTMPSVVHYNTQYEWTPAAVRHRQLPSRPPPDRPVSAVYVLSDGVRRRLVPADAVPPQSPIYDVQPSSELVGLAEFPRRYCLEPAVAVQAGGSMVNMVESSQRAAVWRREDVSVVSGRRRDEIRRQKELDEQQTLVLRFGDIKVTTFIYLSSLILRIYLAVKSVSNIFSLFSSVYSLR